jgi:putative membrane protein
VIPFSISNFMDSLVLGVIYPHLNASLNALATVLLVTGWILIKKGREQAHKNVMLASFVVSTLFLMSYLYYHIVVTGGEPVRLREDTPNAVRYPYYFILFSHIILAISVPILAIGTIRHGLKDNRERHRKWARITFPIWLYVSVTGVIVYIILYLLYAPDVLPGS